MKARVDGKILDKHLSNISKIFGKESSDVFYSSIRVIFYDSYVKFQAMNSRVTLTDIVQDILTDLNSGEFISFLIDAKTLVSFFKNHKEIVDIEIKNDFSIDFTYGKGMFSTTWSEDKTYPSISNTPDVNTFRIGSLSFVPMLKKAFSFIQKNEFRPELGTVFIESIYGSVNLASTDLNRLYLNISDVKTDQISSFMISEEAASILYAYIKDDDKEITICSDQKRTFILFDEVVIADLNIDRAFPNYKYVFENTYIDSYVDVLKESLMDTLSSLSIVEWSKVMGFGFNNGKIVIYSEDTGNRKKIQEYITIGSLSGSEFSFGVQKAGFATSVKSISGDYIRIGYDSKNRFIKIYNPKNENESILSSTIQI